MKRDRKPSKQTLKVLEALMKQPLEWRYGYDLCTEIALKSGTVYPILMRLTDKGYLQSEWQVLNQPGRPPRHAYRLTPDGLAFANMLCLDDRDEVSLPGKPMGVLS